jgi:hypothetical protein
MTLLRRFAVYDVPGGYVDLIEDAWNLVAGSLLCFIPKMCALKGINDHGMLCKGEVSPSLKHRLKEPVALLHEIRWNQKATIQECLVCRSYSLRTQAAVLVPRNLAFDAQSRRLKLEISLRLKKMAIKLR